MKVRLFLALAICVGLALSNASAQDNDPEIKTTIIHAGTLLAVPGSDPKSRQSVIIENDRIVEVRDGYVEREDALLIDLKDKFVMPGMMDMHTHFTFGSPNSTEGDYVISGVSNANRVLMDGFTSVRDLGGSAPAIYKLKKAIDEDKVIGPRMFVAGVTLRPGKNKSGNDCNGPESCRTTARQLVSQGVDVIKIYASCSGSKTCSHEGGMPTFLDSEIQAIMDVAEIYDIPVAAHAHPTLATAFVAKYGVNSIEHGSYMTEATMKMMIEKNIYYVPTIAVHDMLEGIVESGESDRAEYLKQHLAKRSENIKKAYDLGVTFATGADDVRSRGISHRELERLVELGIPATEVLEMSIVNGAKLLRQEENLGSLEDGKFADIIALSGDPTKDIKEIRNVTFVMKGGKIYKD